MFSPKMHAPWWRRALRLGRCLWRMRRHLTAPAGRDCGAGCAGVGGSPPGKPLEFQRESSAPLPVFPLNRPQSSPTSGPLVCAVRNETYFPMCFLSFLIKLSKADVPVAEGGKLWRRLFFNWNMPRAVTHSSRGGGRLMAGHVDGTATD